MRSLHGLTSEPYAGEEPSMQVAFREEQIEALASNSLVEHPNLIAFVVGTPVPVESSVTSWARNLHLRTGETESSSHPGRCSGSEIRSQGSVGSQSCGPAVTWHEWQRSRCGRRYSDG